MLQSSSNIVEDTSKEDCPLNIINLDNPCLQRVYYKDEYDDTIPNDVIVDPSTIGLHAVMIPCFY